MNTIPADLQAIFQARFDAFVAAQAHQAGLASSQQAFKDAATQMEDWFQKQTVGQVTTQTLAAPAVQTTQQ